LGGQQQGKCVGSALTDLTGHTGRSEHRTKSKNKTRPSFEELLAKYKKKGATQEQKRRLSKAKDTKLLPGYQERPDSRPHQGNRAAAPYSFDGLVAPWFWSYPYYYTPLDYSRMHMQSYIIQYPSTYSNGGSSQRPIIANNNLVAHHKDQL
jgi:hypothetical protein